MNKPIHKQAGFTLPEVLIALGITVPLLAMATGFLIGSWDNQSYVTMQAHLKSQSEEGLNRMSRDVIQARRIFGKGTVGTAYLNKLLLKKAPRPIPNSSLPEVRTIGSMSPEKNCQDSPSDYFLPYTVGNSLLFAELIDTVKIQKAASGPPRASRDLDVYRFNYFYVTDYDGSASTNLVKSIFVQPRLGYATANSAAPKRALNLIEWRGESMADYTQLVAYYDTLNSLGVPSDKGNVATILRNKGILIAWKRDENNVANAFYKINSDGSLPLLPNGATDSDKIQMRSFSDALRLQSTGEGTYTIAYNAEPSKTAAGYFPIRTKVPYYYSPTLPASLNCPQVTPLPTPTPSGNYDFPRGFETMVIGPQSGRSVHMRVTVVGKGFSNKIVEYTHSLTVSASDL